MIIDVIKSEYDAIMPSYAHDTDAGADLYSYENITLYPNQRYAVRTGISIDIPEGYVGFITPRSGLAISKGLTVLNAPGTIDSGYRGELKVILVNTDPYDPVEISHGDRIAQIVFQKIKKAQFKLVDEFQGNTERDAGGFGSTGV